VAPKTRQRVVEALHSLGFDRVPDAPSERPATRRGVIGIVCGDLLNPVFPTLLHAISAEFSRNGHLASVAVTDRLNTEERCVEELVTNAVDGIVFISGRHAETHGRWDHYQRLLDAKLPMVFVNGRRTDLPIPHVLCDEEAGARKAVGQLVRMGHRQIGCLLGTTDYIPTIRFTDGYRRTLESLDLAEPPGAIINTAFSFEGGRAGAERLLDRGITAMLAGNDLMALGAVHAAIGRGLHVPRDLSVVGYDGTDLTGLTDPALTTLRQPFEEMARLVADAMMAEIGGAPDYRDHYVFEPELLTRSSSGPPPA
jgi:DNA-binding LacI/PurR family transcriptional regulator